ncbi:hypothetical protein F5Y19DRAFT_326647 [Xylariaceae sp. FL1651]|nr:hypothetical protein F5Y19DRAFT_326647 [Xylariaceae sp. FL1651]
MLEPWDELLTLQKERLLCAQDLDVIKESCIQEHSKNHAAECPECWTRLLNRMRDRYLNSATKEWFSGRRAFLQELDALFAKARQHEVDFKTIEQRIIDEKKEWFRDKVRNLNLYSATKSPVEARTLQQKLNDRTIPTDQLGSEIRECLGKDVELHEKDFSNFLEKLKTAQSPAARAHAYIDTLFQPERDPAGTARSQKYIDMIEKGVPVADVISAMLHDRQWAKGELDQKQRLQKKLEELRRAKAAHELDKAKRDQMRQERARAAMSPDTQDNLPPCSVCTKAVDAQKFLACPLCQILAEQYNGLREATLFCSEICHDEGYDLHAKASHECSSGAECTSLDLGVEMETDEPTAVFCRECVEDLGQASIFCTSHCFDTNFQRHRDDVHLQERERTRHEISDEDQLEFDPEDETRYRARKIEEHIISLHNAVVEWQQKTEASIS